MTEHDRRDFLRAVGIGTTGAFASTYATSPAAAATITIEGGGEDIWDAADEFHYYYEEVTGDFDVTVRIDSQEDTSEWAKAGLMVRQTLNADAETAMIRKTPGHETSFQWRSDDGDQMVSTTSDGGSGESEVSGGTVPATWQRLVRSGDTIEAYGSSDGSNWTLIADISPGEIDFANDAYVGLAVCSANEGTLSTVEFSNLSGLSPASNGDVGSVEVAGSVSESTTDPALSVATGSASNVDASSATLTGSVDDLGGASSADVAFEYRQTGASAWSETATQTVSSAGSVSETATGLSAGTDYEFRIAASASDGDAASGSTNTFATSTDGGSGAITVEGAGADVWNEADEFHYYYAQVSGDFDVTVRIDNQEDTDAWAKAGFMLRESLDDDAVNAMVRKTPGNETSLQWRESAGASTTSTTSDAGEGESEISGGTMVADYQRLVRNGDVVEAYGSTDGSNWTLIADIDASRVDFSDAVYLGLAVTSHNTGTLCTAEFSELSGGSPANNGDVGAVDVSGSVTDDSGGETDPDPVVATGSAADVTASSATLHGSLDDLGDASSADVSFEYRESGSATWSSTPAETRSSTGSFSRTVSGLSSGTDYEFRATATASDGDVDAGGTASFSTPTSDMAPAVSTDSASNVGTSTATLVGSLDSLGGASSTDVGFEYREAGTSSWTATATQSRSTTGSFSEDVSDLSAGTDYEFRAAADASDGDADTGSTATFTTTGDDGSGITVEGAGADIWNEADEGHYYFTDVRGDFDVTVRVDSQEDTDGWAKAGLHFRETLAADAKNSFVRKTPGNESSFSWRAATGGASESTTSDGGDVSRIDGGSMAADYQRLVRSGDTFQAYLSTDGSNWTLAAELSSVNVATDGYLGLAVTSANTGTLSTAEFSELSGVALTNHQDLGSPDASGNVSGGTGDEPLPLVSTGAATAIEDASLTLSASLDALGEAASADVSFEYRETGASAWTATAAETRSSTGTFGRTVSGLSADTEYEYRAVADASDGDADVGFVETATTRPPDTQPVVSTASPTDVAATAATFNGSLDDLGGAFHADVYFEFRESGASSWNATASQTLESTGSFDQTEYGLSASTEYEIRAALEAEDGDTATGSIQTFTTTDGSSTAGGSHVDYEDGFADVSWFDDTVQVITIESLNYGEIQAALETTGPRVVVFEESGVFDLENQTLEIMEPNCWVAGQTAPEPGITFTNGFFQVDADDCIVQHVRVFRGDESGGEGTDPMNSADGTSNVIFDHCTAFWGRDENLSVGYDSTDTTLSNCFVAEGLEDPEENSNGTLIGDGATNVAVMGTVYAKNNDRNPRHKDDTDAALANNLVYYFDKASWLSSGATASIVGCGYVGRFDWSDAVVFGDGSAYFEDNFVTDPGLEGRDFQNVATALDSRPIWPSGFEAMPSGDVESHDLNYAGAHPAHRIDSVTRVIDEIENRSLDTDVPPDNSAGDSEIPDSVAEAGGYPDHGGATHSLDVPPTGLKQWLDEWAVAAEEAGVSPP